MRRLESMQHMLFLTKVISTSASGSSSGSPSSSTSCSNSTFLAFPFPFFYHLISNSSPSLSSWPISHVLTNLFPCTTSSTKSTRAQHVLQDLVMLGFGAVWFRGPFCRTTHWTTGPVRNMCRTAHRTNPHRCGVVWKGSVHGAPGANLLSWCGHGYPDVKSQQASFKPPN